MTSVGRCIYTKQEHVFEREAKVLVDVSRRSFSFIMPLLEKNQLTTDDARFIDSLLDDVPVRLLSETLDVFADRSLFDALETVEIEPDATGKHTKDFRKSPFFWWRWGYSTRIRMIILDR